MWEERIKNDPNLIYTYNGNDENIFKLAIDSGLKIDANRIKPNSSLTKSLVMLSHAIKQDPALFKYFNDADIPLDIYYELMTYNYIPTIEEINNNKNLQTYIALSSSNSQVIRKFWAYHKDDVFKLQFSYYGQYDEFFNESINCYCIEKYNLETFKNNPSLGYSRVLVSHLPEAFKYMKFHDDSIVEAGLKGKKIVSSNIIQKLVKRGKQDKEIELDEILQNEELLKSDRIFKEILSINPNLILKYKGRNSDIFDMSLKVSGKNGRKYSPKPNHLDINPNIAYSDTIMKELVKQDCRLILRYLGRSSEVFIEAQKNGFNNEMIKEELLKNGESSNLAYSENMIYDVAKEDITFAKYYLGHDRYVIRSFLELGYRPDKHVVENYLKEDGVNTVNIFRELINVDPNYFRYYTHEYFIKDLYVTALSKGLESNGEEACRIIGLDKFSYYVDGELIKDIVKYVPDLVNYYDGDDRSIYIDAIKNGFLDEKFLEKLQNNNFFDDEIFLIFIHYHPELKDSLLAYDKNHLIHSDGEISKTMDLQKISKFKDKDAVVEFLMSNPELIEKFFDIDYSHYLKTQVFKELFEKGLIPNIALPIYDPYIATSDEYLFSVIEMYPEKIYSYSGNNIDLYKAAAKNIDLDYVPTYHKEIYNLLKLIKEPSETSIKEALACTKVHSITLKIIDEIGYTFKVTDLLSSTIRNHLKRKNKLIEVIDSSTKEECIALFKEMDKSNTGYEFITSHLEEFKYLLTTKMDIPENYANAAVNYTKNIADFILNFDNYKQFLTATNIKEEDFFKYGFSNSYDYLSCMKNIVKNGKLDQFVQFKNVIFTSVYSNGSNVSGINSIRYFFETLKNFERYPELCADIIKKQPLNDVQIKSVLTLFHHNDSLKGVYPRTVDELDNIKSMMINSTKKNFDAILASDYKSAHLKDLICNELFNKSYEELVTIHRNVGGVIGLKQLAFDNRDNKDLVKHIYEVLSVISIIDDIIEIIDKDDLKDIMNNILDNYVLVQECQAILENIDEMIRGLFEHELTDNLTQLSTMESTSIKADNDKKIKSVNLADKKYCLLIHALGARETVPSLFSEQHNPDQNTICLSVASNRGINPYNSAKIVFATDELPPNSYIRSSAHNMSTNGDVSGNSFEDKRSNAVREQKGALKLSDPGDFKSSEVFAFREGIKFKYIIVPETRKPTKTELEIASQYGLEIVITQAFYKNIENPHEVKEESNHVMDTETARLDEKERLDALKQRLIKEKNKPRKIAVFADAHGLFEPTLAILEDARKYGATEIYSLGDNIGTGPNPKEVMDLLKEYGVISIKGNHEEYVTRGIEPFLGHLRGLANQEQARRNSCWTRDKLTPEQLDEIALYPESIDLPVGDKKIHLTHYHRDYNTEKEKESPEGTDLIIEGHEHFMHDTDDRLTLRGAGVGGSRGDRNEAFYIIITEKADGSYYIEKRYVPYDIRSIHHEINESSLDAADKINISGMVGASR